ncbi:LysR family transcriptional regulator [Novosphingobium rosa]|uniref:LysR family transcriptional regulator n=1 Tax=Novosphingobium rosa TaxID=76978 RepID=UPI0008340030|nr:LysR family transcriptional regulator [Novosphingobium rosa]
MRIFDSIDLRHLRALDMIMTELSITRAAERLALTQPAISNSLARLREHFGDELLAKHGARLVLTPFAQRLQPALRALLADAQALVSARPHFDPAHAEQNFILLAPDHLASIFLPDVVREVSKCSPLSRVTCMNPSPGAWKMLMHGDVDVTVQPLFQLLPDHLHDMLFAEPWVYIARRGHPIARPGVDEAVLAALPQVRAILPRGETTGTQPQRVQAQMSAALIPAVVAASDLVARVPGSLAQFQKQRCSSPLEVLPCSDPATMIHMQWPICKNSDPTSRWFRDKIAETLEPFRHHFAFPQNENA